VNEEVYTAESPNYTEQSTYAQENIMCTSASYTKKPYLPLHRSNNKMQ